MDAFTSFVFHSSLSELVCVCCPGHGCVWLRCVCEGRQDVQRLSARCRRWKASGGEELLASPLTGSLLSNSSPSQPRRPQRSRWAAMGTAPHRRGAPQIDSTPPTRGTSEVLWGPGASKPTSFVSFVLVGGNKVCKTFPPRHKHAPPSAPTPTACWWRSCFWFWDNQTDKSVSVSAVQLV